MPHIHEKIDFIANAYIVHENAVLLRLHDKYGEWYPPGGHIELDEEPQEAVVREVKEEVGMDVELVGNTGPAISDGEKTLITPRFMDRHRINDTHEHISFIFFAQAKSHEFSQGDGVERSEGIRWFTREDLADPSFGVAERVQYYAKTALDELAIQK